MNLYGKDLITTQEWSRDELTAALELAEDMQKNRFSPKYSDILAYKTFFMFFYNPSVRTRQSFECAATELGGHAQYLEPGAMRLKTKKTAGETTEDAAKVMSRYACGIGIRILEDKITKYGEGDEMLREYARWADIPIISMAHDKYHPCQGLADIMGLRKHLGKDLKGKKLLLYWGHGALARSWCSVQEALLIYSRFGMDVTVACPQGYDLDPRVVETARKNCGENSQKFEIIHDPVEGYNGAHAVYSRNWMGPNAYHDGEFHKQEEIEKAMQYTDWICDQTKMKLTDRGRYIHPMPVDRGHEVTDEVCSNNNV
ncbi:MAG: ornithine carbamoyltransferase [Elusimicrobia bacterium]|nr:ornithine carbamoyltransferase [Elusimicrobiota bacterium]